MKYVILAGGSGTRLFPLSRESFPKQFLRLFSEKSILQETILRLNSDDFIIVTAKDAFYKIKEHLEEIEKYRKDRILLEPFGRNTAPAIIYALSKIEENEIVAVLPSDHFIKDENTFRRSLTKAKKLAEKDYIVTIGIVPEYPETGYGYLELEKEIGNGEFMVKRFVEKPDMDTAKKYFKSGNYLWNGGMFVFKKKVLIDEIEKVAPKMYEFYNQIISNKNSLEKIYKSVENISIDYAVMENSKRITSVKGDFGWNDIGCFKSLFETLKSKTTKSNVGKSKKIISIESKDNLIFSEKPIVSLINIKNLAIIDTKDVLLVSDIENSQKVKDIYSQVKEINPQITRAHPDEERPWGKFESIMNGENFKVKWIKVKSGERLSLQYHNKREEYWTIIKGKAIMTLGEKQFEVKKGDRIKIEIGELHSIEGITETEFIEIQMGDYLGEDDIVRVEDKYKRGDSL